MTAAEMMRSLLPHLSALGPKLQPPFAPLHLLPPPLLHLHLLLHLLLLFFSIMHRSLPLPQRQ
jgi:hypothetical protein